MFPNNDPRSWWPKRLPQNKDRSVMKPPRPTPFRNHILPTVDLMQSGGNFLLADMKWIQLRKSRIEASQGGQSRFSRYTQNTRQSTMSKDNNSELSLTSQSTIPRVYEEPKEISKRRALFEVIPENLKPISHRSQVHTALIFATKGIRSKNPDEIVEGLRLAIRLVRFHPLNLESKASELNEFISVALVHLSNKPLISRATAIFFKELISLQLASVESDCEKIIEKLLDKSADSNPLISGEVVDALQNCVKFLPETKCFHSICKVGLQHPNLRVRSNAVRLFSLFVRRVGGKRFEAEYFESCLVNMVKLILDAKAEIRFRMQKVFRRLLCSQNIRKKIWVTLPKSLLHLAARPLNILIDESIERKMRRSCKKQERSNAHSKMLRAMSTTF